MTTTTNMQNYGYKLALLSLFVYIWSLLLEHLLHSTLKAKVLGQYLKQKKINDNTV